MDNPIAIATNTYPDDPTSCIGKWIKINDTVGQIFCLEPIIKVVILQTKHLDFQLFTFDAIQSCQIAKPKYDLPLFYMDLEPEQKLVQKIKKSEEKQIEKYKKIGVGVSSEAQMVFDALSKTLPVQWHNTSIIVMEQVLIEAPYTALNCKLNKNGTEGTLARVKKVVAGERKRLGLH